MKKSNQRGANKNAEIVGLLTAISIVSKRLADNLERLKENGEENERKYMYNE